MTNFTCEKVLILISILSLSTLHLFDLFKYLYNLFFFRESRNTYKICRYRLKGSNMMFVCMLVNNFMYILGSNLMFMNYSFYERTESVL